MNVDRLLAAVSALVRAILGEQLPGLYSYRVVGTTGERVDLQSVKKGVWPDLVATEIGASPAGSWVDFTPGAIVLVAFEDADPKGTPLVVSGPPKGREGHVPVALHLDANDMVRIGASAAHVNLGGASAAVHRVGDTGTGGTLTIGNIPGGPPPTGLSITYTNPAGVPTVIGTLNGLITVAPDPIIIPIETKAQIGSPEVKA